MSGQTQRNKDTVRCGPLGAEVPRQEADANLDCSFVENALFDAPLIVKSQQIRIELVIRSWINQTRIDGVGLLSLQPDDKFDAVFIDPVESTGRLNESAIQKVPILNRASTPRGTIYPQTIAPFLLGSFIINTWFRSKWDGLKIGPICFDLML